MARPASRSPPSTAAVKVFDAGQEADEEIDDAVVHQEHHAGDGGLFPAPMTKVREIVRSTSTPNSDAIFMSCSQARCWRPSRRRGRSARRSPPCRTVTTTTTICSQAARRSANAEPPSTMWPPGGPARLGELDIVLQQDAHADGRDQRRQLGPASGRQRARSPSHRWR